MYKTCEIRNILQKQRVVWRHLSQSERKYIIYHWLKKQINEETFTRLSLNINRVQRRFWHFFGTVFKLLGVVKTLTLGTLGNVPSFCQCLVIFLQLYFSVSFQVFLLLTAQNKCSPFKFQHRVLLSKQKLQRLYCQRQVGSSAFSHVPASTSDEPISGRKTRRKSQFPITVSTPLGPLKWWADSKVPASEAPFKWIGRSGNGKSALKVEGNHVPNTAKQGSRA